jgi:hypothetical protein
MAEFFLELVGRPASLVAALHGDESKLGMPAHPFVWVRRRREHKRRRHDKSAFEGLADIPSFAAKHGFTFPYAVDETQEVARAYDAQCTPDFFGFNA